MGERVETTCPACAESILAAAKKCRHCGSVVAEARALYAPEVSRPPAKEDPAVPTPQPWTRAREARSGGTRTPRRSRKPSGRPLEVSFLDALPLAFENFGDFEGRATRGEYWWFILSNFLLNIVVMWLGVFLFGAGSDAQILLYWAVVLVMTVPGLSVFVRRLHDTGRSGWWWLLGGTVIGLIPLLIWLADEGVARENEYGPPRTA